MDLRNGFISAMLIGVVYLGMHAPTFAQTAASAGLPADPWPRDISLSNAAVLVYQPQVAKWDGNQIEFRTALAIKPTGAKQETFGVAFATARTQVDKVARTVVFENLKITKSDFPTLPNHGAAYAAELQTHFASDLKTHFARSSARHRSRPPVSSPPSCRSTTRRHK